jgi:hypothetical protein
MNLFKCLGWVFLFAYEVFIGCACVEFLCFYSTMYPKFIIYTFVWFGVFIEYK